MIGRSAARSIASACTAFSLIGRQSIGRRRHQDRVAADGLGRPGVLDRVLGAGGARADDQRQPAAEHVLGISCKLEALLGRTERRRFTGGATDDDAVHPGLDQELKDLGERLPVDLVVRSKRSDGGRVDTFNFKVTSPSVTWWCRRQVRPASFLQGR